MNSVLIVCITVGSTICFCFFWLAVAKIEATKRQHRLDELEIRANLLQDLMQRNMPVEDIERILIAWSGNRRLAKKMLSEYGLKDSSTDFLNKNPADKKR